MILGQELRRRFIETEWDTKFSSSDPCDSSSTSQGGIQSQIDSFVSVASALKRQLSLKLANSSNTGMKDIPFSAIKALAFGSNNFLINKGLDLGFDHFYRFKGLDQIMPPH